MSNLKAAGESADEDCTSVSEYAVRQQSQESYRYSEVSPVDSY